MFIKFDRMIINAKKYNLKKDIHENGNFLIIAEYEYDFLMWQFSSEQERDAKFAELEKKLLGES